MQGTARPKEANKCSVSCLTQLQLESGSIRKTNTSISKHWLFCKVKYLQEYVSFNNFLSLPTHSLRGQFYPIWTLSHVTDTMATPSIMTSLWRGSSEHEPTTRPSAVTLLVPHQDVDSAHEWRRPRGSVWGNVWLIVKAAKEHSRSLPTPKCHSRYIIPACIFFIVALQLCSRHHPSPALKSSSMVQSSSSDGEGYETWGHWVEIWFNLVDITLLKYESVNQRSRLVLHYARTSFIQYLCMAKKNNIFFEIMLTYARANQ